MGCFGNDGNLYGSALGGGSGSTVQVFVRTCV